MIRDVRVLDRVTMVAPLGLRFQDAATGAIVGDGLAVTAYPPANPLLRTSAYPNRSGVYALRGLPGLRDLESGTGDADYWRDVEPHRRPFVVEVVDELGRFQPCRLTVRLPQRYLRTSAAEPAGRASDDGSGIPLFSTPSRVPPAGLAVLRAELEEPGSGDRPPRPAAWAVLGVTVDAARADVPATVARGVADERGRVAVIFPYPPLSAAVADDPLSSPIASPLASPVASPLESPLGSPLEAARRPLARQAWQVTLGAAYQPTDPVASLPELTDLLGPVPPGSHLFEDAAHTRPLASRLLRFGEELVVKSEGDLTSPSASPPSVVFVTAVGSPP